MTLQEAFLYGLMTGAAIFSAFAMYVNNRWYRRLQEQNDNWSKHAKKLNEDWCELAKRQLEEQRLDFLCSITRNSDPTQKKDTKLIS